MHKRVFMLNIFVCVFFVFLFLLLFGCSYCSFLPNFNFCVALLNVLFVALSHSHFDVNLFSIVFRNLQDLQSTPLWVGVAVALRICWPKWCRKLTKLFASRSAMKVSVCQCVCLCVLAIVALAIKIDSVIQNHIEKAFYRGGAAAAAFVSCMIDRRRDQFLY